MTIPQHVVQTGLICFWFPKLWKWYIITAAIILTILPDVGRLFQQNPDDWTQFYQFAHSYWYVFIIPFWNLHIIEDYFVHQPQGGWYWWVYYLEGVLWILESIIISVVLKRYFSQRNKVK